MEQHNADLRENPRQATDAAGFLRDMRGLRLQAALEPGELAARAHFPRDVIAMAETGPALPQLPVLAAYVRGCGGTEDDVAGWEDRWRSVSGTTASPLLPTRVAGVPETAPVPAASGVTAAAPPEMASGQATIMAALDRFAERMAQPDPDSRPAPVPGPALAPEPVPAPASEAAPAAAWLPQRSGRPSWISVAVIIAAVAICLLLILLAL